MVSLVTRAWKWRSSLPRVPRLYASNEQGSNGEGNFGGYAGHMKQTGEDAKDRDLEVVHTIG